MSTRRVIEIVADWTGLDGPTLMGRLTVSPTRGKEVFAFEYVDSSPDRWGRVLMRRREAQLARAEKRAERRLLESDYLLGVHEARLPAVDLAARTGARKSAVGTAGYRRRPGLRPLAAHAHRPGRFYRRRAPQGPCARCLGCRPAADLEQLWRRIVFFVCVSNTDDHLRNHGFMLEPTGWALAPAYDINPDPHGAGLQLNISETDNAQDLDLVLSVASVFRVTGTRARQIVADITGTAKQWRSVATSHGLSRSAQDRMRSAFRVAEAWSRT